MRRRLIFIFLIILFCPSSFAEMMETSQPNISIITQAEILDLALKPVGLEFFLPRNEKMLNREEIFEMKKNLLTQANYPVFKEVIPEEPADCSFLAEAVYEITTPPEKRDGLSCEGIINLLERRGYRINCACGQIIERETAISLFQDPQFLRDVMSTVDPIESSPYSSAISEAYSSPASPVR